MAALFQGFTVTDQRRALEAVWPAAWTVNSLPASAAGRGEAEILASAQAECLLQQLAGWKYLHDTGDARGAVRFLLFLPPGFFGLEILPGWLLR